MAVTIVISRGRKNKQNKNKNKPLNHILPVKDLFWRSGPSLVMFHCSWPGTAPPYSKSWWTKAEFLQPMLGSGTERQTTNKQKAWRWNSRCWREAYVQHKAYRLRVRLGLLSQRLLPCPWVPRCWQAPAVQGHLFKGSRQRSALLSAHRLYNLVFVYTQRLFSSNICSCLLKSRLERCVFKVFETLTMCSRRDSQGFFQENATMSCWKCVTQGAEEDARRMPKTWVMSARTHTVKT